MENKKTCLYDRHIKQGATMQPFAGFEMPMFYTNIVEEHQAVRQKSGVFDVSHMGEIFVNGEEAEKFVNYIFTNDIAGAEDGKVFYGMMLNEKGGVVDDLLVYKLAENDYLLVVNASNIDKDFDWIKKQAASFKVNVENRSEDFAQIAVQGPEAELIMESVLGIACQDLAFYTARTTDDFGGLAVVSRTGYTGEDGFEIYGSHDFITHLWDQLVADGRCVPCGLGCRDTLRFESGLPLYGNELSDEITPLMAGLGMFCKIDQKDFIGKDALIKQKQEGLQQKLVGITLQDNAIARHGYQVVVQDQVIGTVTTGYKGISVNDSICVALIDKKYAENGNCVGIQIRKKTVNGIIGKKRFYSNNYKK